MKRLLLKISILALLVALIMALGIPFLKYTDDAYEMATIDKRELLRSTKPPRIIFVGGSNLAFGLDSKSIEETIGIQVINMGLHGGLGLRYNLLEVKPYIRKRDVIVIIPEYEQFFGTCFDGTYLTTINFLNFPEDRKILLSLKAYLSILKRYPQALGIQLPNLLIKPKIKVVYNRRNFNEYGDNIGHLNKDSLVSEKIQACEILGKINMDVISELNSFKFYAEKTGAMVFFNYPCLIDKQYKKNEKKINSVCDILRENLKIPILSTSLNYVLPEDYFYDTIYHLNTEGRNIRTQKIIADLKKVL